MDPLMVSRWRSQGVGRPVITITSFLSFPHSPASSHPHCIVASYLGQQDQKLWQSQISDRGREHFNKNKWGWQASSGERQGPLGKHILSPPTVPKNLCWFFRVCR